MSGRRADKPKFELITASEYDSEVEERLRTDRLQEDTIYHFLARPHLGNWAVRGIVQLKDVEIKPHSSEFTATANMDLLDEDFRPRLTLPSHLLHGYWGPSSGRALTVTRGVTTHKLVSGYFLGYDDGIDDDILEDQKELSLTR